MSESGAPPSTRAPKSPASSMISPRFSGSAFTLKHELAFDVILVGEVGHLVR